jgi:hypothetical protein
MRTSILKDWPFFFFLLLQIGVWYISRGFSPDIAVVPDLPGEESVKATSFGDEQLYFRVLAYEIQNAGDTYGRATPLKDYDYNKLYHWWLLLDSLDSTSNFVPALAAYYYVNTQNKPDVRYVVDYLEQNADRDPKAKWWWYAQACFAANYELHDKERALEVAKKLAKVDREDMPFWTKQLPAFILADMGQLQQSVVIIEELLKEYKEKGTLPEGEMNFMHYYISKQLDAIKEKMQTPQEPRPDE